MHKRGFGPWWFSRDGSGRFDLLGEAEGSCYLADDPLGTYVEKFREAGVDLIAPAEIEKQELTQFEIEQAVRLADCTASNCRGFGVTGAIHSTPNYDLTQAWALALWKAGFGGIRYFVSHDPSQTLLGVALFGWDRPEKGRTTPVPLDLVELAEKRFRLRVRDTSGRIAVEL